MKLKENPEKKSSHHFVYYLIISIVGFVLYFQTLFFGYSFMDDDNLILNNQPFLSNLANFSQAFRQDVFHNLNTSIIYYRPIQMVSYLFDAQLAGSSPSFYHFNNIILHLINSGLVFYLFLLLKIKKRLAFFCSLIFTVHPVAVQAVAWLPGRNDTLLTFFALISFIFFIKFIEIGKITSYLLHLSFFFLGILTKEPIVGILPISLFYFHFIKKEKIANKKEQMLVGGWLAVLIIWWEMRSRALAGKEIEANLFSILKDVFAGLPSFVQSLGKIFFPFNLTTFATMENTTYLWGGLAIFLIILTTALGKIKKEKINFFLFGLCWFIFFLLPTLARINSDTITGIVILEHRLYLPLIGFLLAFSSLEVIRKINFARKKNLFFFFLVLLFFSFFTFFHSRNFRDRLAFWKNAVKGSPDSSASIRNLGTMYYLENKLEEAEKEYRHCLELSPDDPVAHNNLGVLYLNQNKLEEAEKEFKQALRIIPHYDQAMANLALVFSRKGREQEAIELWEKTVFVNPYYLEAYLPLVNYYKDKKVFDKANYYLNEFNKRKGTVN